MTADPSIYIGPFVEDDESKYDLKVQSRDAEVNIILSREELEKLKAVSTAKWDNRTSLKLGLCMEKPVFGSLQDGLLSILSGHDDESWDVGIWLPESMLRELYEEIDREL